MLLKPCCSGLPKSTAERRGNVLYFMDIERRDGEKKSQRQDNKDELVNTARKIFGFIQYEPIYYAVFGVNTAYLGSLR